MGLPRVELEIAHGDEDWGKIVLELEEEKTPETVKNFLAYVKDGFYDGTIFHRVIANFMIQGGGFTAIEEQKTKGVRARIKNEAADGIANENGVIAMARTNDPHSATSQFFINVKDNAMLDHPGSDGWGYCAFGRVVEGMDVVERVRDVDVQQDPAMGEKSQPVNPPQIKTARILS